MCISLRLYLCNKDKSCSKLPLISNQSHRRSNCILMFHLNFRVNKQQKRLTMMHKLQRIQRSMKKRKKTQRKGGSKSTSYSTTQRRILTFKSSFHSLERDRIRLQRKRGIIDAPKTLFKAQPIAHRIIQGAFNKVEQDWTFEMRENKKDIQRNILHGNISINFYCFCNDLRGS